MQPRKLNRKRDPRAKRRDETYALWQARLDAMSEFERETGEPIITPEAEAHGEFDDVFVPDEGGQLTKTKRRRSASSMARMHENGQITADQHAAALEIALVAELIERNHKRTVQDGLKAIGRDVEFIRFIAEAAPPAGKVRRRG